MTDSVFKGTAAYYAKYRQDYGIAFFDEVRAQYALDGRGTMLDLGCGTGQLALPLARDFERVVGIDVDAGMVAEAQSVASQQHNTNVTFIQGRAEDIPESLAPLRLTTIGAAFHWMDRARVLNRIYDMTELDGGVAIVYDTSGAIRWNDESLDGWRRVRRDVIQKYLGTERRAGQGTYVQQEKEDEDIIRESPFKEYHEWEHEYVRTWTIDSIIGFLYSTSFAAPHLFGPRKEDFEKELTSALLTLEPSGMFPEDASVEALFLRKK